MEPHGHQNQWQLYQQFQMNPGFLQHCVFTPAHDGTQASTLSSSPTAPQNEQNGKLESQHSVRHPSFYGSSISPLLEDGRKQEWQDKGRGIPPAAAAPQGITTEELAVHSAFGCEYFVISKTC